MSSFLDSTGLSRLVSKITDYFAKKDGTYPDMTVGNVSNVVPIAKLPTASSVTSNDTTHVPTVDAVYKHLNSFIARGVGNVAVVYKPLTEVWDENHRGLFKLQYAVSDYFGEYFIEIQCKGTITSSNPLGDGGFARVYSNFSTNLGSNILKYAIVDNYVVFGFSVSNADRYMCLEVCGHSVSVAAIKELSGYTFTVIAVSNAFWSVKSKAEDAPVGSPSIPVYVKSDGSVTECTDIGKEFWIEGTGASAMYKTIGSIEFNANGYFSQLSMEIGPLGTKWTADSQASKILVKLICYGSNYKLDVLAINYSDITSRCLFDTYKADNRVYIVVKIVAYGAGAYAKVVSHGERSWTAGVSYSAGTAPATLDGGTKVTYKYAKINAAP